MTDEVSVVLSAAFAAALEDAGVWDWWLRNRGRSYSIDSNMAAFHEAAKAHRVAQRDLTKSEATGSEISIRGTFRGKLLPGWVTSATAARRLAVTPRAVTDMAARGRLQAKKDGSRWLIATESIEEIRKDQDMAQLIPGKIAQTVRQIASDESGTQILPSVAEHIETAVLAQLGISTAGAGGIAEAQKRFGKTGK